MLNITDFNDLEQLEYLPQFIVIMIGNVNVVAGIDDDFILIAS